MTILSKQSVAIWGQGLAILVLGSVALAQSAAVAPSQAGTGQASVTPTATLPEQSAGTIHGVVNRETSYYRALRSQQQTH